MTEKTYVCARCKDTHLVYIEENDRRQMCTSCPTPCQECQSGGCGAYCEETPCKCKCHVEVEDALFTRSCERHGLVGVNELKKKCWFCEKEDIEKAYKKGLEEAFKPDPDAVFALIIDTIPDEYLICVGENSEQMRASLSVSVLNMKIGLEHLQSKLVNQKNLIDKRVKAERERDALLAHHMHQVQEIVDKKVKDSYSDGYCAGFDGLEMEVAAELGDVGANTDHTVAEHVRHLRKDRDKLKSQLFHTRYVLSDLEVMQQPKTEECDHRGYEFIADEWVGCSVCDGRWELPEGY
jgi:hypothetical protein